MKHVKSKIFLFGSLRRIGVLSLMLSLGLATIFAQQLTVRGTVLDEFGETLIGVNIIERGTGNGVITDIDGNYTLTVSNGQSAVLQFSFIGYNTKAETVGGRTTINVTMDPSVVNLGEVVAIGYGTQTRREITGSVANLTEENFRQGVTRTAADLMQGKVAGLSIVTQSGSVGSEPAIRLRGVSTLYNDQGPFIVIDGVPGGQLSSVAPEDIESISVLKDAASAAIYGSRSAGGVILITTKRGQASRTSVSYSGYMAAASLANKPKLMTADEWRNYARENGRDTAPYDRYGANTDWIDEITRTGIQHNHNVSLSGGSSKSNYRASYNYQNNEGILRDDALERHNFRFQVQQRAINDRLRLGITGSGTILTRDEHYGDNIVLAFNMLPVFPVKLSDGSWFDTLEYDQGNPVRNQEYNVDRRNESTLYGQGDISFTILEGLDIKGSLYKSMRMLNRDQFNNSETHRGRNEVGWARRTAERWDVDLMEWMLEYRKDFGAHKVNALAGYSWQDENWTRSWATNRNFVTNVMGSSSLQSGQGLRPGSDDVSSWRNMNRLISFYGRVNYSYEERYMLTAMVRRDGSTRFGANHKWGIFPSVSAAWGISQENFMKDLTWVDDLKLRVGYGVTGNQATLEPYRSIERYGTDGVYYDDGSWLTAYRINQNANPDLKWESTAQFNIGIDFGFFNGRLNGTVEWYKKITNDMLYEYNVPTPPFMHNRMWANVGSMENTGFEVALNWNVVRSRDFNWTTSLTADHNRNKITRLSNESYTTDRIHIGDAWVRGGSGNTTHVIEEGRPFGQFYGWKFLRFDENGHYVMEKFTEGDGPVTDLDKTYIGDANPVLTYGWTNSFNYKNWDFQFFFRGTIGNKVLNHQRMAYAQANYLIGANALSDPLIYELKEVPKYCSLYIEDGSHVRLDNLVLGYTFNTRNISWLDRARVYIAGQNVFVLSKLKGPDPEVDISRNEGRAPGVLDRTFYPKAHVYSVGVSLVF